MSSLCLMCFDLVLANPSGSQEADRGHRLPILVRLGKSEVQERTAALFAEIVPLLTTDPAIDLRNNNANLCSIKQPVERASNIFPFAPFAAAAAAEAA